jgi:protein SCO1/2
MRRRAPKRRAAGAVTLAVALAGLTGLVSGCGSSSPAKAKAARPDPSQLQAAGVLEPVTAAPPLTLHNSLGQPVNIDSYRGKAVLVTFIYTHCPDVCPLITSNLRVALNLMGPKLAKGTQVIAVSVDPKGDTRRTVTKFLAAHEMTGRMQYLIGSAHELAAAWKAWGVGAERDVGHPDLVEHTGIVYGITGSGKRMAVYSADFKPADVAHDVPILAGL